MTVYGLDLGHTTVQEAENWLACLPSVPDLVACTHIDVADPCPLRAHLAAV